MTRRLVRAIVSYPFMVPFLVVGTLAVGLAARNGAHAGAAGIVASLLVFYASAALMHATARMFDHTRLTIATFFYVSYLAMIYVPAFVVFGEQTDSARWTFLIAVQSVLIMVPLGVGLMSLIARFTRRQHDRFYSESMVLPGSTTVEYHVAVTILAVAAIITVVYFSQLEFQRIPLVYMFAHPNDVERLQILREESFKLFDPRWNTASSSLMFYAFLFLRTLLYPFLILFTFGYYLCTRQWRWLGLFVISLVLGGFYAAASIARAPLAAIVMRIMFFYYVFRHGEMGRRMTTILVAAMLAFPVLVTGLAYGSEGMSDAFLRVGKRFFYTPADDLYVYFEVFPRHVDYQYGGTLAKPILKLFELPYFYIENYVYMYQFPNGVETGHANAAFPSNLHADFGLVGVVLGGLVVGMIMQGMQIHVARQRKTVLAVATYAFMMYAFWVLNFGSITSVLGTNGVVAVLVMAWGMRALTRMFRRSAMAGRQARLAAAGELVR